MRPNGTIHMPTVINPAPPPLSLFAKPRIRSIPLRRTRPRRTVVVKVGGIGRLDALHTPSAVWPPTVTL